MWHISLVAPQHVGSSRTRARTGVPCIGRRILNHCATKEVLSEFLIQILSIASLFGLVISFILIYESFKNIFLILFMFLLGHCLFFNFFSMVSFYTQDVYTFDVDKSINFLFIVFALGLRLKFPMPFYGYVNIQLSCLFGLS